MKLFNLSQIQPEEKFLWDWHWGTPKLLFEKDGKELKIAFLIALFFHGIPLGYIWQRQSSKSELELVTTLQNVELIEPEKPSVTPLNVEEPKSALEFLKMALPIFKKNPQIVLGASEAKEKIVEISKIPSKEPSFKTQKQETLVEKTFVNPQKPSISPQIGFAKK